MFSKQTLEGKFSFLKDSFEIPADLSEEESRKRILNFFKSNWYHEMQAQGYYLFENYPESDNPLSPLRLEESIRITVLKDEIFFELAADRLPTELDKDYAKVVLGTFRDSFIRGETLKIDKNKFENYVKIKRPLMDKIIWIAGALFFILVVLTWIFKKPNDTMLYTWLVIMGIIAFRYVYANQIGKEFKEKK
jgi:hypothetical protein